MKPDLCFLIQKSSPFKRFESPEYHRLTKEQMSAYIVTWANDTVSCLSLMVNNEFKTCMLPSKGVTIVFLLNRYIIHQIDIMGQFYP